MTNNSRCSPPLHLEPGVNLDELQTYYLLTGPAAGERQGVYSSWPAVQSLPGNRCVKYQSWELLEAAWHRCCDAGEHTHPPSPPLSPPPSAPFPTTTLFVVRGSGSVRTSYDAAAADLTASTLGGLYQADDPHIAAHIARGSYIREAEALVDAEKAIRGLEGANPSDDESVSRQTVDSLERALQALRFRLERPVAEEEDGSYTWDGHQDRLVYN
ncbi:hypothetical protein R3P38DRAFT_3198575 [Favolaschia claudopus]|uniref:Uncharacterized protein n=1 Tax=Favolaschia claudopus TaxID=2862362 RepID=A0AAW0B435_9AGAR